MVTVFVFSAVLLAAVLLSAMAARSVLSTAVLFLVCGSVFGPAGADFVHVTPTDTLIGRFAELALVSILFTDGMHVTLGRLRQFWQLPARALLIGLPLTVVIVALLARQVAGLPWPQAWLIGAALCPTDPVFAAALIGAHQVPQRLRELLNVESGMNDGLALPLVVGFLAVYGRSTTSFPAAVAEAAAGVAIGMGIAWGAVRLNRTPLFEVSESYGPIVAFAVWLLALSTASLTHANEFLAAFAAGMTLATAAPEATKAFRPFGEPLSEILKLAALLLFGALISPAVLGALDAGIYVFAVLVLIAARPLAMLAALGGTEMSGREIAAAAWFGPKGFASVFFGFLILSAGVPNAEHLFHVLALVVALSIIAHSSTDVLVARWFETSAEDIGRTG